MAKLIPAGLQRRPVNSAVVRETNTASALSDALSILNDQIQILRVKSNTGYSLDQEQIKSLRTLVQSICDISREEREQDKHDGLDDALKNMSEQELLQLYHEKSKKP
jgi:signal transduction histidine kinase